MSLLVRNLINKSITNDKQPQALCFFYDGLFDKYLLDNCDIKLYGHIGGSKNPWTTKEKHKNLEFVPQNFPDLLHSIDLDFVLSNDRTGPYYEIAKRYSDVYHLPLLTIEHSEPPRPDVGFLQQFINKKETTLYVDKNIMSSWGVQPNPKHILAESINWYKNTDQEKDIDLLICGKFKPEDYNLIYSIINPIDCNKMLIPQDRVDIEEIEDYFLRSKLYLHLATTNDYPHNIHRAMWNKCTVISSRNNICHKIVTPDIGKTCFLITDFIDAISNLLSNEEQRTALANNAFNKLMQETVDGEAEVYKKTFARFKKEVYTR